MSNQAITMMAARLCVFGNNSFCVLSEKLFVFLKSKRRVVLNLK